MSRKLEDMLDMGVGSNLQWISITSRELAIPLVAELLCAMKAREALIVRASWVPFQFGLSIVYHFLLLLARKNLMKKVDVYTKYAIFFQNIDI